MYCPTSFAFYLYAFIQWLRSLFTKLLPNLSASSTSAMKSSIDGPIPLPIIGSLHLIGRYATPFEGFTALSKKYGDIYAIHLGTVRCVVVNNFALIKEVLIKKGAHFGGRPNYLRYHKLFGGDRNNSLALCDWSDLQKKRRHIARIYCSPKLTSHYYQLLNDISAQELDCFSTFLTKECDKNGANGETLDLKPILLAACGNMFFQYMCTARFSYSMRSFRDIVRYYDEIFWDINQGYAVDFIPWLLPFYGGHMNKLAFWAGEIRQFVMQHVVDEHFKTIDYEKPPRDFTDALLQNLKDDANLEWQHIVFELEDFIGGHSAVGNLVLVILLYLIKFPYVKRRIEEEIRATTDNRRIVNLFDKCTMVYTEATIFEALRFTSSPIVPHVATKDTELQGHFISRGTCVILNNFELNKDTKYWDKPHEFRPERFIKEGRVVKPEYFIPFGTGKRTCIGQQLVNSFSFVLVAGIIQRFDFDVIDLNCMNTHTACVALPPDPFRVMLKPKRTVTI